MWIEALARFNHHEPGDVFEAGDEDAKLWIGEEYAKRAKGPKEKNQPEGVEITEPEKETKGPEGPPKDKAAKKPEKKK